MTASTPVAKVRWNGPIIMIGFGSIGAATLPLLCKHFEFNSALFTAIDPLDTNKKLADMYGVQFIQQAVTSSNYRELVSQLVHESHEQAFIVNVSTNVSSKAIIALAHELGALYVDTTIDPWPGVYFNNAIPRAEQSNYVLRESLLELRNEFSTGPTAVSCCGANPGMASWLVKQALLNLAHDTDHSHTIPTNRSEWGELMMNLGVKGIHIAERDSQVPNISREQNCFMNTWSAGGCLAESLQPAELGWGTHEKLFPHDAHEHTSGCKAAIYLDAPGGNVKVRTWTPHHGADFGYLITHNEAISIADYFTVHDNEKIVFRPTCHYAYRPTDAAVESLTELFNERGGNPQSCLKVLSEHEITSGSDELGVLLYGHKKGAYWYGSRLSIDETRTLAPHQNATGLQVSSAILAGMMYTINHPNKGLIEADEMDFNECLEVQKPYLGTLAGYYTDWNPHASGAIVDSDDPWQFSNIRI